MAKVFGIGLSRTGTTSLTAALRALGYRATHYPDDAITERELKGRPAHDRPMHLSVLDRRDAMTDTPAALCYRQLDLGYPGSRFVLTLRDERSWLASISGHFARYPHPGRYVLWLREQIYGTSRFEPETLARAYWTHVAGVLEYFVNRPSDLLCYRICDGDGWLELCRFLKRPILTTEFPRLNAGHQ